MAPWQGLSPTHPLIRQEAHYETPLGPVRQCRYLKRTCPLPSDVILCGRCLCLHYVMLSHHRLQAQHGWCSHAHSNKSTPQKSEACMGAVHAG